MSDSLLFLIALLVLVMAVLYWVFHPYRCHKCGCRMEDFYDQHGRTWKVCPECGHQELIGGEDEE